MTIPGLYPFDSEINFLAQDDRVGVDAIAFFAQDDRVGWFVAEAISFHQPQYYILLLHQAKPYDNINFNSSL